MRDKLIELVIYGFILLYIANWCGEFELSDEGKYKIRKQKEFLFITLNKRGYHLHNIILQILNFALTLIGLIISFILKERELTVLLIRIAYLFLAYTSVICNLSIAVIIYIKRNKYKKRH